MPKLPEHAEVISHRKVLDDLRLLQAKAMDVLDREFSAVGSECRSVQRRDHGKVAQVCARQSHVAHDRVSFSNERVDLKSQVRKGPSPSADDLLNDAPHVGIPYAEIGKLLGEELVNLLDLSVIPKLLKVPLDAVLAGIFRHDDPSKRTSQHTPYADMEIGQY